ncbi:hypothetical protein BGX21_010532 [Mortierella sp. AD011]|nr:hypothetical protein BGX20_011604 [Mortierella sp. AD010]KAF9393989.1 hypothetical protein BGX21_010532 [Mortierella sp. AD011]
MKITTFASSMLLLCSSASVMAHFMLVYPPSRGFNDDAEPNAPCGGFNTVQTNRSMFPLTDGFVDINSFHPSSTVTINVAIGSNPNTSDFTAAAASSIAINHPGHACLSFNLTSIPGAANNTNATIQLVYSGGDGSLYQCADVVLVTSAPGFDKTQCITDNGSNTTTATSGADSRVSSVGVSGVMASVLGVVVATLAMV